MLHLDYRDARPIYSQIMDSICTQIRAGVLESGEKLPSVRELAGQLAINPNTIQRAYRELESQGWITTIAGKGCFVCGIPGEGSKAQLLKSFDQMVEQLLLRGITKEELMDRLDQGGTENA